MGTTGEPESIRVFHNQGIHFCTMNAAIRFPVRHLILFIMCNTQPCHTSQTLLYLTHEGDNVLHVTINADIKIIEI